MIWNTQQKTATKTGEETNGHPEITLKKTTTTIIVFQLQNYDMLMKITASILIATTVFGNCSNEL